MTTQHFKKSISESPLRLAFLLIPLALACFALSPGAQAVSPPPDGGYPNGNTAEGNNALLNLTTGQFNTAVGLFSLALNMQGDFNTGVGASALRNNTTGNENTALGRDALNRNTTGFDNTATGSQALFRNTEGGSNTATGFGALYHNTTAGGNTATGSEALFGNTTGGSNTANGIEALSDNTTGSRNVAVGGVAMSNKTTGDNNTAIGYNALQFFTSGNENIALGAFAGAELTTGSNNVLLGASSGENVMTASNVIAIGAGTAGTNESNTCFIGNIFGAGTAAGVSVLISENGRLGTVISSKRFKKDIQPMDKASEALFSLKPVSFRYKKEIDPASTPQLGLVAEDVEKVNPGLIVRDKEGKPYSVRYEQVNAMLLNEFLKEHREVAALKSTVAQQQKGFESKLTKQEKQIEALTAGLQKVSAQLEASKPTPQVVNNP